MSTEILEPSAIQPVLQNGASKLRFDEFGVMEDDQEIFDELSSLLTSMGFKVYPVEDAEQAVNLAKNEHVRNYILDVRTGKDTREEGLDTLERLKLVDESIFVCIYSGFPHKRKAARLKANLFQEKSENKISDLTVIINNMLDYCKAQVDTFRDRIIARPSPESDINVFDLPVHGLIKHFSDPDKNLTVYKRLMSDPRWINRYAGQYIAIREGKVIGPQKDRDALLSEVLKKFPNQKFLFRKIEEHETVLDVPSPLDIE